jgi:hypothetical protein
MGPTSQRARRRLRPRALLLVLLLANAPRGAPAAALTRQDLLQALHHRQQMIHDWGVQTEKQIHDLQDIKLREEVHGWLQQLHALVDDRQTTLASQIHVAQATPAASPPTVSPAVQSAQFQHQLQQLLDDRQRYLAGHPQALGPYSPVAPGTVQPLDRTKFGDYLYLRRSLDPAHFDHLFPLLGARLVATYRPRAPAAKVASSATPRLPNPVGPHALLQHPGAPAPASSHMSKLPPIVQAPKTPQPVAKSQIRVAAEGLAVPEPSSLAIGSVLLVSACLVRRRYR